MKAYRVAATLQQMLDPDSEIWRKARPQDFIMLPTPLNGNAAIKHISPFLERSTGHGSLRALRAEAIHNGSEIALRLSWKTEMKHDKIADLDQFVDAVACMFPLSAAADASTMGGPGAAVNAWYWKADQAEQPFDVIAEGYGSSERRAGKPIGLKSTARYADAQWRVVITRPLAASAADFVQFRPDTPSRIAFALWNGGNQERSGRKSFSGAFTELEIEA